MSSFSENKVNDINSLKHKIKVFKSLSITKIVVFLSRNIYLYFCNVFYGILL